MCHPCFLHLAPRSNEHVYVYSRLPNLIQGQGQLAAKLTFQPASLQASAKHSVVIVLLANACVLWHTATQAASAIAWHAAVPDA